MKKALYFVVLVLALGIHTAQAQWEIAHWQFGDHAGIDFGAGAPTASNTPIPNVYDGTTSLSDGNGNLLFFSDGQTVWNKNSVAMPNGTGLLGNVGAGESAVAMKVPGSSTLCYLFTMDYNSGSNVSNGLNYSVIDMSLQGGLGDVTSTKNVLLDQDCYEKMALIRHKNNSDAWIVIVDISTDDIYSYLVTNTGVSTTPVISNVGYISGQVPTNTLGIMKASPDGSKLAISCWGTNCFYLMDFDNSTGMVSNKLTLGSAAFGYAYGIDFSADGSKLYATCTYVNSKILQFDLTAGSASNIVNTAVTLASSGTQYDYIEIQRGPDQKIYVSRGSVNFVSAIDFPNITGTGCHFKDTAVVLTMGTLCRYGLPSFMNSFNYYTGIPKADPGLFALLSPVPLEVNTTLQYEIQEPSEMTITFMDVMGREMNRITPGMEAEGKHSISIWKYLEAVPSGTYFIRLACGSFQQTLKVIK